MSIFQHPQIDTCFLSYLTIDKLRCFYKINKYYRNLIFPILKPFFEFQKYSHNCPCNESVIPYCNLRKGFSFGNIQICEYLITIHNYDFSTAKKNLFFSVVFHKNIEMISWLHQLFTEKKIYINIIKFFMQACVNNNLKIAKLLYSFGEFNINIVISSAQFITISCITVIKNALKSYTFNICNNNADYHNFIDWLYSLKNRYKIIAENDKSSIKLI